MRSLASMIASLALAGCYQSHQRPGDGSVPDAGCQAIPRGVVTLEIEVVSASPSGCARPGHTYEEEADLSGGPVFEGCPDSRVTPTADGCGLAIEAECRGVEYLRRVSGVLRGPRAAGSVDAFMVVGYAAAECNRVERWRVAD